MKRALVLFLVLGIVAGSLTSATAAKKKKPKPRVVTAEYGPNPTGVIRIDIGNPGTSITSIPFVPRAKERKVSVAIADDSGQLVRARVMQDGADGSDYFCGKTSAPVPINHAVEIQVVLYSGVCGSGAGVATKGVITATFSG